MINWGKILICGNGGSAAQADHFAAEMIGDGLPCVSLTNPAVITALANDYVYEEVFSKQVEALGEKGDLLICLTTSGLSRNISMAAFAAHRVGMKVFTITGQDAPEWNYSEYVRLPYKDTQVIQEKTLLVLHKLWKELI